MVVWPIPKGARHTLLLPSSSRRKAGLSPDAEASGKTMEQDARDLGHDDPGNLDAAACAWLSVDLTAAFRKRPYQATSGEL